MTMGPNRSYETVDMHNSTGAGDKPCEPMSVHYQASGQQQTVEPVYEELAAWISYVHMTM